MTLTSKTSYSVLLLYPDYAANSYGQDTYYTSVEAESPADAVEAAREEATAANESVDTDDWFVLLVIKGDHKDVQP